LATKKKEASLEKNKKTGFPKGPILSTFVGLSNQFFGILFANLSNRYVVFGDFLEKEKNQKKIFFRSFYGFGDSKNSVRIRD